MIDDLSDSVAVHALNALPVDEAVLIEVALELNEDLAAEFAAHREVVAELAEAFPDEGPWRSPLLWDRITQSAGFEHTERRPDDRGAEPGGPAAPTRRV
jgi:anti-sigma-K factor RskA